MGFDPEFMEAFLHLFKFLMVIPVDDLDFGLEYIRSTAKKMKGGRKHAGLVDEFIDAYFYETWMTDEQWKMCTFLLHGLVESALKMTK